MKLSKLSSIYECCSDNNFNYILRNNLINDSFIINEREFEQFKNDLEKNIRSQNINSLIKSHIVVPDKYDEIKFIDFIKNKYQLNKPSIQIFYLTFNTKCNLACKYCYVEGSYDKSFKGEVMSEETFEDLIKFLEKIIQEGKNEKLVGEKLSFIFYGSEPLLYEKYLKKSIEKIDELSRKIGFEKDIQIITNATLITGELTKFFKKFGVELAISIDGTEKINDSMRIFKKDSKGTYKRIIESIEKLKEAEVRFGISCTIGPHNINHLKENIKFFKRLGAGAVGFNILLNAKNREMPFISINKSNDNLIEASKLANSENLYEDRVQRKVKSFNKTTEPHLKDCGALGNQIVFYPNGEIGVCQAYLGCRKYTIGDVHKDFDNPLKILENKNMKKWTERYPLNMEECLYCPALGICGGGCTFNAELNGGDIYSKDKPFCVHTMKILTWLLEQSVKEKFNSKDIYIRDISFMFQ